MDEPHDDRIRDVVRHAHETDPEPVDFDVEAGLAEVLARVGPGIATSRRVIGTTRFLSAAAHLDENFADAAMREFLVEPNRALPPDPDVDTRSVLGEVAAANGRRWIRDGLLVALMAAAVVLLPWPVLVTWLVLGAVVGSVAAHPRRRIAFGAVVVAGLVTLYLGRDDLWPVDRWFVLPPLLVLVLAVLLADKVAARRHLRRLVRGAALVPRAGQERRLRPATAMVLNRAVALPPGAVSVTVARGRRLFVGAGDPRTPSFVVVPLDRRLTLTTSDLYDEVVARMTPAGGFRVDERVIVDAEGLLVDLAEPAAADFLRAPDEPPVRCLSVERARELRRHPLGWARSYLHFHVETAGGMVVSSFLHMRIEDHLYAEWRPFVLRPVSAAYRGIDTTPPPGPLGQTLLDLVTLPVTAPHRLRRVVRLSTPWPAGRGSINPDRYGSAHSLRELAAGDDTRNDFELADEERYLRLLERRFTAALTGLLRDRGFSSDEIAAVWSGRVADREFYR